MNEFKKIVPLIKLIEKELEEKGYIKGSSDWEETFEIKLSFYRKFGTDFIIN